MDTPRVSVITINFNGARYLPACVQSVCAQTYDRWEHVVVDCGSTDDSLSVLESLRHSRLRVIRTGVCGLSTARNRAVEEAAGEFCAVLDADDEAMPQRLEKQLSALERDESIVAVGGNVLVRHAGARSAARLFRQETFHRYPIAHEELTTLLSACLNPMPHSTLTVRKSALERIGGYRESQEKCEDFDVILRLAALGRLASIDAAVGIIRAARSDSHTLRHRPKGRGWDFFACRAMFTSCVPAARREQVGVDVDVWLDGIGQTGIRALQGKWLIGQLVSGKKTPSTCLMLIRALVSKIPSMIRCSNQRWIWSSPRPDSLLAHYVHPSTRASS